MGTNDNKKDYRVSVVLPTYNRLDRLQKVLGALEKQTVGIDSFEVVVVSDGSKDGTNDYLTSLKSPLTVKPVLQENTGVAGARNSGFHNASGDLIMFIDDDVVPTPTLIAEHLKKHAEYVKDIVVVGPMLTPDDFDMAPWVQYEQAMLVKQYNAMLEGKWEATARQFYTGNTSLPKSI